MSSPIFRHQLVSGNVFALLRADERRCNGRAVFAPCDVLIRRTPRLQVRQPDLLFVANDRVRQQPGYETTGYLAVAPNLVVEILFDSDRKSVVAARRADYFAIGVDEVWIIQPEEQTATVLSQGVTAYTEIARYTPADTLVSVALPALVAPVSDFFDGLAPVVGVV